MSANLEKQMVALGRVLQTLREEENIDVLIETTLNYINTEFDYSLIWMGLYDRLEHRLVGKGGVMPQKGSTLDAEASRNAILKQRFPLNPGDLLEQVVIQQRPVGVPDLREEKRAGDWRRVAQQLNIQGTIVFPIRYRDLCLGVVLLGSERWGISPKSEEKARIAMILGELASTLNLIEVNWHRQQAKRPEDPLLMLLGKLPYLPTLNQRLEAVVTETHKFIGPTRTNVYWFEREGRYFWKRAGNLQKSPSPSSDAVQVASGLTVQDMSSFYQALVADQVVSIGSSRSSLNPETTSRLMSQIKARSLLAAPILYQNELLGFLAVEGTEPRIWDETERNYVRAAAQLVALTAPLEETEQAIALVKQDQALTSEIVRAIYSDEDWKNTLDQSSHLVCDRLGATRFILLLRDPDQQRFDIAYQSQPAKRRTVNAPLSLLSEVDERLLEQSELPIAIENWDEDLKLTAWRTPLMDAGIRSLVACNTAHGHSLEGVLIVAHDVPKSWNKAALQLILTVGQQIGSLLHQWQMQRSTAELQKLYADIQWGLTTLQQMGTHVPKASERSGSESKSDLMAEKLATIERVALQQITQILQAPLTMLVTWELNNDWRHAKANADSKARRIPQPSPSTAYQGRLITWQEGTGFGVSSSLEAIAVRKDPLIKMVLSQDGVCRIRADRIPAQSRSWANLGGVREVLALALRTSPEHEPTGVILVADHAGRQWVQRHLDAFGTLVTQLAWSRRNLVLSTQLQSQQEELECLNWYKQRRIEDAYHTLASEVRKLNDLGTPKDALTVTRYQQGLRQLENAIAALTQMLKDEQWALKTYSSTMPVVSLLKRAFMRVDRYIKERQLWLQVHGETGALNLTGDIFKVELVVYELLLLACLRSPQGSRIDIWCQPQTDSQPTPGHTDPNPSMGVIDPVKPRFLELSITDSGKIDPRLVSELQSNVRQDILSPSPLNRPPGLNLLISQSVMRQLGGDLHLYQLDDGRVLSRLLLPIR